MTLAHREPRSALVAGRDRQLRRQRVGRRTSTHRLLLHAEAVESGAVARREHEPAFGCRSGIHRVGLVVDVDHGDACGQSRGNAGFEPRATEGSTVDTVPPKGTPGGPAPQVITMLVTPKTHGSRPSALHRR